MIANEYQKLDTYGKYLDAVSLVQDREKRRALYSWLFERLGMELGNTAADNNYTKIPRDRLREMITRSFLMAAQSGDGMVADRYLPTMKSRIPAWKEYPFLETLLRPGFSLEQTADRVASAIDSSTQDAALVVAAARVCRQSGRNQQAVSYFEQAIRIEPTLYPGAYLELGRLYLEEYHDRAKTVETLRSCIEHSRGTPEAREARRILDRLAI